MQHRTAAGLLVSVALMTTTLGWTTVSWGQAKIPRVGIITFFPIDDDATARLSLKPFRDMLTAQGWIEGKNVSLEYRSASSDPSRFAEAAAELREQSVFLNGTIDFMQIVADCRQEARRQLRSSGSGVKQSWSR